MTLVLDVPPETAAEIEQLARQAGTTPSELVIQAVARYRTRATAAPPIPPDKLRRALDQLAAIGAHLPPIPEGETYSRESLYSDDE